MNETIDHLVWPVVYVELGRDEELMLISDTDWFHDIDAKHAIGPIEDGQHYFVDAVSQVFKLIPNGKNLDGVPSILVGARLEDQEEKQDVLAIACRLARRWHKIESQDVPEIIQVLNMPSKVVVISSRIFIYAARLKALALSSLLCLAIWGFPRGGLNFEFLFNAIHLILVGLVTVYLVLKIKSLRFVTKNNSVFSVSGFRVKNDYQERSLVKVQVWVMRGWAWTRLVFKTDGGERVENTLTNSSFLLKPDDFGIPSNLIQKMSWYSHKRTRKGVKRE